MPKQEEVADKQLVEAVERLLVALNKANYTTVFVENFPTNATPKPPQTILPQNSDSSLLVKAVYFLQGQLKALFTCRTAFAAESKAGATQEIKTVLTTEPALSYTFGGLTNEAVVKDVLARLNKLGVKATFFVTETEMRKKSGAIREIIKNGHEIGIAIRPKNSETVAETSQNIMRCRKLLQEQFGVTAELVKQPWGEVSDTTKEAVAALNCKLIGQSVNIIQNKHKNYTSAQQVIEEVFGKHVLSLARGQILYFRMDFYVNNRLVGDLLETIKQRKVDNIAYATSFDNPANNPANDSQYVIKPVGELLNNTKYIYQYPVDPENVPERLRSDWRGLKIDNHNFLAEVAKRYIGNELVNDEDRMIGFSKMESRRIDKKGVIHTESNVIFLTFDDWGTDAAVNKILYVLRKHNVPGTFFILTKNVLHNPNLLRAIAVQGHDIGCHSDSHKPLAIRDPKTGRQVRTQDKEEYVKDLATSYQKLLDVTGDVTVNGKPVLTRMFRPPQLAISKMGFEALLAGGYEYIVDGSGSTYDYAAQNVSQLIKTIKGEVYTKNGEVKKGAVLIWHMSDTAAYSAMALDILLTANAAKDDSDPSKFKVGRLSDYLTDGYSQIDRKQSLNLNRRKQIE